MRLDFYNRDWEKIWLENVGDEGWWQLRLGRTSLFNYINITFNDDNTIYAIDPPGGPFIAVGDRIGMTNLRVMEIKRTSVGIFLRLETLICIDENK